LAASITVRRLLNEADMELKLLTPDVGLDRVVEVVHHSDLDDPTPWMVDGTVLISHGAQLVDIRSGVEYLDRIVDKTAALVLAVGSYVDEMHPELVQHACKLGMPVIEVPKKVATRTITAYFFHAVASRDMHRLRRTLAVHGQLLDSLIEEEGVSEVVTRLSTCLEMDVVLFDRDGFVIACAGRANAVETSALWRMWLDSREDWESLSVFEADHGRIQLRRVEVHGRTERLLASVSPAPRDEMGDMALSYAQRIFALDLVREREQAVHRRRIRSALLRGFLSREDDARDCVEPLGAQEIDVSRPWRVLVFGACAHNAGSDEAHHRGRPRWADLMLQVSTTVDAVFSEHGLNAICGVQEDVVAAVVVFDDARSETLHDRIPLLLRAIEEAHPATLSIGVSGVREGSLCPAAALRQATTALRVAEEGTARQGQVVFYDEVSASYHVMKELGVETLAALQNQLIVPLEEHDREHRTTLLQTARAYIANRMSAHETADVLFVHRNTLHKRLRRIEELLGIDLHNMDDAVDLYLALGAADLLKSPDRDRQYS